jgi:hypothetical protein
MDKVLLFLQKVGVWFEAHPNAKYFALGFGFGFIIGFIL